MSLFQNPSAAAIVAPDVQPATTAAQPVEAKSGEDVQKTAEERRYTGSEMEQIVKDRLAREQKKFAKEKEAWQSKQSPPSAASKDTQVKPNIENEFKEKLSDYETKNRTLAEQLAKYRERSLNSEIERELAAQGCVDPELVKDHFLSRRLVQHDDEGNLVVENISGKLEDLVSDYLAKKPHLKRSEAVGGAGTKQPRLTVEATDDKSRLMAQIEAVRSGNGKKLFGK